MGLFGQTMADKANDKADAAEDRMNAKIRNRQTVINPYAGVTDLSGLISNPFANLQVATAAAEMQAEESDISLASTLDTLRATGAGASGATALAQAALRSKKGVAANIAQQEAQNERLRAQGEQAAIQARMGEAERLQNAEVYGQTFMFQAQEQRDVADISREASMMQQYSQQAIDMKAANRQMLGSLGGGLLSGTGAFLGSDRKLKKNIKLIGYSPSGFKIYAFEYINKIFGEGVYQGVMSDEIPQKAVIKHIDGYDRVDYSKLDVEFKRI